ncbi:hypothetical protein [Novibacillus thermophilus]|uniref:2,4-diaminopentanoate dehydrogenase C-terminal domain-containing protein n=1 Tax=Novibacillus thermophilus TaxID=1471761 RepID=A0A1U9K735_9BACL|nr:hypothetical protein [Novibacillus thermophilus]AQS55830.1 hypothetical protein B0W44_08540 [Novibacillus thermophilus]
MHEPQPVNVLSYGLGPIGLEIAKKCLQSPDVNVIGAVDIDPQKAGRDLGLLTSTEKTGISVVSSLEEFVKKQDGPTGGIAIHATGSDLKRVWPQIKGLLDCGFSVVSTCEELSYPWDRYPSLAKEIHTYAKDKHLTVLGTGVNPGFVMDTLALCLSAVIGDITAIQISRRVDVSKRRLPLQKKVGVGLEIDTFNQLAAEQKIGHVGLEESVRLIAYGLNLQLRNVKNSLEPTLSEQDDHKVAGLHQTSTGQTAEGITIALDLVMATGIDQVDEIVIHGDETRKLVVPGGIYGDTATAAIAINCSKLLHATPVRGLKTMADIGLPRNVQLVKEPYHGEN